MVDPTIVFRLICPDAQSVMSKPSSRLIGTLFGAYLGRCYVRDNPPHTYTLVDWTMFRGWKGWEGQGSILDLRKVDMPVWTALINSEWNNFPWRADILDADRSVVYEIKPVRSADDAPPQLQRYLTSLNSVAAQHPDGTPRIWSAGGGDLDPWDPRRYPMIIPGVGGGLCAICPWLDPNNAGVILYDIVCCQVNSESAGMAEYLAETKLTQLPAELQSFEPAISNWIGDQLPLAPINTLYALLVPRRFFEAFVLIPRAQQSGRLRQVDRLIEAQYGPRPGPVLGQLVIETWLAAHVLTGPLADAAAVTSGWISSDDIIRLYKAQLAAAAAIALVAIPLAATDGAALAAVPELETVPELEELAEELEALTSDTTPAQTPSGWPGEPVPDPAGPDLFQDGAGIGEATEVGPSIPPWNLNPPPLPASLAGAAPQAGAGLGVIGAFLIGGVAPDAQAGTGTSAPTGTTLVGADSVMLLPAELITPVSGQLAAEQKVKLGDATYYIAAIVTAQAPSP